MSEFLASGHKSPRGAADTFSKAPNVNRTAGSLDCIDTPGNCNQTRSADTFHEPLTTILLISTILICLVVIVGNVLVVVTVAFSRKLHTITSTFLLNLAISDLLVGVAVMPFVISNIAQRTMQHSEVSSPILTVSSNFRDHPMVCLNKAHLWSDNFKQNSPSRVIFENQLE